MIQRLKFLNERKGTENMNMEHFASWCADNGLDPVSDFEASKAAYLAAHPSKEGGKKKRKTLLLRAVGILDGVETVYSDEEGKPVLMEAKNTKTERQERGEFLAFQAAASGFERIQIQACDKPAWEILDLSS